MAAHFELDTIWWSRLRALGGKVSNHEERLTRLESARGSPRSSIKWRRLIKAGKALLTIAGLLVRHGGLLLAGATMAWAFVLPALKWIWKLITGFIAYVAGVGIGV